MTTPDRTVVRTGRWVDVISPKGMRYWARELGCSEWKLLDAVALVGMNLDDLRRYLASQQPEKSVSGG